MRINYMDTCKAQFPFSSPDMCLLRLCVPKRGIT